MRWVDVGARGGSRGDLVEVIKGDGCYSTAHTGGQGLAGVAHEVGDAEEAPQGLGVLQHFEVPAGGRDLLSGLTHPGLLPPWSHPLP